VTKRPNDIRRNMNGTITIFLKGGHECVIDDADYNKVKDHRWYASICNRSGKPYVSTNEKLGPNKFRVLGIHRLLLDVPTDKVCDHINGDTLDNRRENIRPASIAENMRNRSSGCGWKGVKDCGGSFAAAIGFNKKRIHLGTFKDAADAAQAYNFAAAELHGEFARYNEVPQPWLESIS
jgi:hypothetical protein